MVPMTYFHDTRTANLTPLLFPSLSLTLRGRLPPGHLASLPPTARQASPVLRRCRDVALPARRRQQPQRGRGGRGMGVVSEARHT